MSQMIPQIQADDHDIYKIAQQHKCETDGKNVRHACLVEPGRPRFGLRYGPLDFRPNKGRRGHMCMVAGATGWR